MNVSRGGRLALTILLAIYGFRLMAHPGGGSLMDSVDLPIHETGHLVFAPFGEFMQFLGGTLFQVIMPALFVAYFLRRRDRHAASVALWWVGQNFWNISVYARDARTQALPLVGGGEHDWAYLLGRLGWLSKDQTVGRAAWTIGAILYFTAIAGGLAALATPRGTRDETVEGATDPTPGR